MTPRILRPMPWPDGRSPAIHQNNCRGTRTYLIGTGRMGRTVISSLDGCGR